MSALSLTFTSAMLPSSTSFLSPSISAFGSSSTYSPPMPMFSKYSSYSSPSFQIPKNKSVDIPTYMVFASASYHSIPHPSKIEKGGEDAPMISSNKLAIGIADGVGGWNKLGIDPGVFARELMQQTKNLIDSMSPSVYNVSPLSAESTLSEAHSRCAHINGSSTALLCLFVSPTILELINVGDSAALILTPRKSTRHQCRKVSIHEDKHVDGTTEEDSTLNADSPRKSIQRQKYEVLLRTKEQRHSSKIPFQLGGGRAEWGEDRVDDGERYYVDVKEGDIVVIGSDGVWDNLWDEDVIEIVEAWNCNRGHESEKTIEEEVDPDSEAKEVAKLVAEKARERAEGKKIKDPKRRERKGGKIDDTTVVVAIVGKGSRL